MLELVGLATVHEVLLGLAEILEETIRDIGVSQLVLDDGVRAHLGIRGRSVPSGHPVGRSAHELRVRLHRELHHERLAVPIGHLVHGLDDVAPLDLLLELLVGELRHRYSWFGQVGCSGSRAKRSFG